MAAAEALHKIRLIKQRYIIYRLLADALLAFAFGLIAGTLMHLFYGLSLFWIVGLFFLSLGVLLTFRKWQVSDIAVASFLDASYPELEESAGLVLQPPTEMNLLQRLQLSRVSDALANIPSHHKYFTQRLRVSVLVFAGALVFAIFINKINYKWIGRANGGVESKSPAFYNIPEAVLPQLASVDITIVPPAYTHLAERKQDKFTLEVEEGATISWKLKTNISIKNVSLLFNEQENVPLKASNNDKTEWIAQKAVTKPGFYQVIIDSKRSDLYQLQVIKDNPAIIQIKTPKQYTYIDAGEKPEINISATVTDDYGVSDAAIFATIAKGSGEAVKFKEQKLTFDQSFGGEHLKYQLQKTVNLPSLGLEPGDELYFYLQATDNHQQQSRTDVYIVSIQDTAQLLSMDGILSGVNIKPEYFRSERQIILDSQSLLKVKDSIGQQKFNDRSNDLGTDQKLLRLRYGKFLGEESENEIGYPREAQKDQSPTDPKDFGNGAKILDEYTDKHDNAEDAQFFDPTVKAQLKTTLTEMWKAELQLRLYKPADALPFEYKALRLLKDLQQKSRSYVAKTAYNPSPLKMDKRLTGDLSAITRPAFHSDLHAGNDQFDALRKSVAVLEQLKESPVLNGEDYRTVQSANQLISAKATQQPAIYLSAARAMRRILNGNKVNTNGDVAVVEEAIQKILPASEPLPQNTSSGPDMGLSRQYFFKLNHSNR